MTLLSQIDPTSVKIDTRNFLFDPTDDLGEGFAKFVSKVVERIIAQTDRIMKEAIYGLNRALDNPFTINYGGIVSSRSNPAFDWVVKKERYNLFWGVIFSFFGLAIGNPVFVAGGLFFALLFMLRNYLV